MLKKKLFVLMISAALVCGVTLPAYASQTEVESEADNAAFVYAEPKEPGAYDLIISKSGNEYASTVESDTEEETGDETKDETILINYRGSISDDVTGNWRLSIVSTEKEIGDYVLDFVTNFLASGDEIHALINMTRQETYRITELFPGTIDISVLEYVDREEHSAKTLFSGDQFEEYWLYTDTGELEDILNEE